MESYAYCVEPGRSGLTCRPEDLEVVRGPARCEDQHSRHEDTVLRCRRCAGLYKHVYSEKYETRFMDCDEGWWTTEDHYHKVAEPWTRDPAFSIEEATQFGYDGPEETLVNGRCGYRRDPNGLSCRFSTLAEVAKLDSSAWIKRCMRCGQVYMQVREPRGHRFYKPGEALPDGTAFIRDDGSSRENDPSRGDRPL